MARQKKPVHRVQMTEGKRNIIHQLLEEYDIQSAEDIQDALKDLLGGTIKEMMEAEMDDHLGSSLMTLTTTPNQLTDALESLLGPLKKIHVPVHEISMMMSIALRFIPILLEETDKIMKAQMARGADFESGNIIQRVKNMVPLLVPLFISAFRRANDLALAMEARCYHGGEGRTQMKPLRYQTRDYAAYGVLMAYLVCSIGLRVCGL